MQIGVIPNSSVETFNLLVYPEQNPMNQQFVANSIANLGERLQAAVGDKAREFMDSMRNAYETAYNSQAMRAAKAALRSVKNLRHPNAIIPLVTLEELRSAKPVMQRYLMADPVVRQMLFDQRIDGYQETYKNIHGKDIGPAHYDYRRVTHGIVMTPEERADLEGRKYVAQDGDPDWSSVEYFEDLIEGDRQPEFTEQVDILYAQKLQRACMNALMDSSNPLGGDVGA